VLLDIVQRDVDENSGVLPEGQKFTLEQWHVRRGELATFFLEYRRRLIAWVNAWPSPRPNDFAGRTGDSPYWDAQRFRDALMQLRDSVIPD
jgi:hypothetical protein